MGEMGRSTLSSCTQCGAVVRVDLDRAVQHPAKCSRCKAKLPLHGAVSEVDGHGLEAVVRTSKVPVVVDFWASWCGPCKAFAPVFSAAAEQSVGDVVFLKLDTERHPDAASRFGIQAIPTLVLFRDGREVRRQAGAMPPAQFRGWLADVA